MVSLIIHIIVLGFVFFVNGFLNSFVLRIPRNRLCKSKSKKKVRMCSTNLLPPYRHCLYCKTFWRFPPGSSGVVVVPVSSSLSHADRIRAHTYRLRRPFGRGEGIREIEPRTVPIKSAKKMCRAAAGSWKFVLTRGEPQTESIPIHIRRLETLTRVMYCRERARQRNRRSRGDGQGECAREMRRRRRTLRTIFPRRNITFHMTLHFVAYSGQCLW